MTRDADDQRRVSGQRRRHDDDDGGHPDHHVRRPDGGRCRRRRLERDEVSRSRDVTSASVRRRRDVSHYVTVARTGGKVDLQA